MGALTLNMWVAALIYEDVEFHSKKMELTKPPCDLDIRVFEPRSLNSEPTACDVKVIIY